MLLLKMGPEVPSRARRALPALRRSDKEDGRRPSEFLVIVNISSVTGLDLALALVYY